MEFPTRADFSMPSLSRNSISTATWSRPVSSVWVSDSPHPGMSIAITRNDRDKGPMFGAKLVAPVAPGPLPCSKMTGCPSPSSR